MKNMKRLSLILTILVTCVLLVQVGCREHDRTSEEPNAAALQPEAVVEREPVEVAVEPLPEEPVEEPVAAKPEEAAADNKPELSTGSAKFVFENVTHDFGDISPRSKNTCEFKFKNAGDALLRIGKIHSTCGCTVPELSKKEYAPGESGVIKATFNAGRGVGTVTKRLYVPNNDKKNSKVTLTIRARIVMKVAFEPSRIMLLLENENAGCPNITLKSVDGKPFAVTGFSAPGQSITADFDPAKQAAEFVLKPKADIEKLKKHSRGTIRIALTHPGAPSANITYQVVPEFQINPNAIVLRNVKAQRAEKRKVSVVNNYGRDFEIESIRSQKDAIRVVSREKVDKEYKLNLEIIPPVTEENGRVFRDVLSVKIKDGPDLTMSCRGFYSR
jgi:hypothetical protein